jgi:hypothetical protein
MTPRSLSARDLRSLTDVQLFHHLDDAIASREGVRNAIPPSRAARLLREWPIRHPIWHALLIAALEAQHGLRGAWLAIRLESEPRLEAWARSSHQRMADLLADIAMAEMLTEMQRRVRKRPGGLPNGRRPSPAG